MNPKIRLFIRDNELNNKMIGAGIRFKSLRHAIRYVTDSYSSLGKPSISRGLFYDKHYKQIMISLELAACDNIAMIIVES